jgi:hypothetical protein
VKHLAEPERIDKDAKEYVVWVTPEGSDVATNVGALKVDDDLRGKLETTVPYEKFTVKITPEKNRVAVAPTGPTVIEKSISR